MNSAKHRIGKVPLWRKIFSSNWWWYGEVNPDPARLPPPESRPRLWRRDYIIAILFGPVGMLIFYLSAELNSRYWFFNENQSYEGVLLVTRNSDRQLLVQLKDTTRVEMGLPIADILGYQRQINWRPTVWAPAMKKIIDGHYQCPGRRLRFYGESWKFTFAPVIRIWRVDCADTNVTLLDEGFMERRWRSYLKEKFGGLAGISLGFSAFFAAFIIYKERKLNVKT